MENEARIWRMRRALGRRDQGREGSDCSLGHVAAVALTNEEEWVSLNFTCSPQILLGNPLKTRLL